MPNQATTEWDETTVDLGPTGDGYDREYVASLARLLTVAARDFGVLVVAARNFPWPVGSHVDPRQLVEEPVDRMLLAEILDAACGHRDLSTVLQVAIGSNLAERIVAHSTDGRPVGVIALFGSGAVSEPVRHLLARAAGALGAWLSI